MTLREFFPDADQFNIFCCLDIREQVFYFRFGLEN